MNHSAKKIIPHQSELLGLSEINFRFLIRAIKIAIQNIIRNPILSLSNILVITLILILFHITFALKFFSHEFLTVLNKKVDILIEIKDDVSFYQIEPLMDKLKQVPGVNTVIFNDKEAVLKSFLDKHISIKTFLNKYKLKNPLPSSLEITTNQADTQQSILTILKEKQYESLIVQTQMDTNIDQKNRIEKLLNFGNFVNNLSNAFMVVFVVVTTLIVFNVINIAIHYRKNEIYIMNLVGATKTFIQFPFIIEGALISVISLVIAIIADLFLHYYLVEVINSSLSNQVILDSIKTMFTGFLKTYPQIIAIEAGILLFCAITTSLLATEIYLSSNDK